MKGLRFALLAAALVGTATVANAQGGQGGGQGRPNRMSEMLFKDITLTSAEQTKVDSIMAAYRAQMPRREQGQQMDSASRAQMMQLREKQYTDLRAVLTSDQQKTFDTNLTAMREAMRNRQGGRPPQLD